MSHVTLDEASVKKLEQVNGAVDVRTPSGRVIGRFLPLLDPAEYEGLEPQISDEERQRRKASKQGKAYTTAEVLAHLEKL